MVAMAQISYFFFTVLGDEQLLRQMSLEVLAFSEYLVHYGAHFYLKALLIYSAVFGGSKPEVIREEIGVIAAQMEAIGDTWGWCIRMEHDYKEMTKAAPRRLRSSFA
jgi:hypothetical protein